MQSENVPNYWLTKGSPLIDASVTVTGSSVSLPLSWESRCDPGGQAELLWAHYSTHPVCRFSLHSIRRIHPFLTREATQLPAQALMISPPNYGRALWPCSPAGAVMLLHQDVLIAQQLTCWCTLSILYTQIPVFAMPTSCFISEYR